MNYKIVDFTISPLTEVAQDILMAMLSDVGFDSFQPTDTGLLAYVLSSEFSEDAIRQTIADFLLSDVAFTYTVSDMENRDWNEEWEQNSFDPVLEREFGIRLHPHGAFGSGSHPTTYQLVDYICHHDFSGQTVLDMGCGTGVLGIAMALHGAVKVTAIDIDEMSVANTKENFQLNNLIGFEAIHGDATAIEGEFHTIVANIHKNIIIHDLPIYVSHLKKGGTFIASGFFTSDADDIIRAASQQNLRLIEQFSREDWVIIIFKKAPVLST